MTDGHRRDQLAIRAGLARDLTRLWAVVDPTQLADTIDRFTGAGVAAVATWRRISAHTAADYYSRFRVAEGAPGRLQVPLADPLPEDLVAGALRGAGLAGIINARRAGRTPPAAANNGLVRMLGQATSLVMAGGRLTVLAALQQEREP